MQHNGRARGYSVWKIAGGLMMVFSWGGLYGHPLPTVMHQPEAGFFPDQIGNEWRYQGRMIASTVNQIANTTFVNISRVTGTQRIDGVTVTVFHDTNAGNQGSTESYYRQDAAGIRYYGSKPGTKLEKQLIPYQIVRLPLEIPSSFEQLNRTNLNLGLDLDHDGQAETVDVSATVTVQSQEAITVPVGTYREAVRIEAHMKLLVSLSRDGTQIQGFDSLTAWFVKNVGLVKYLERQMVPNPRTGKNTMIEITEELEEAQLQGGTQRLSREQASMHGVLTRHTVDQAWRQASPSLSE